jgi:2-phosphosulfolactate phosphatase
MKLEIRRCLEGAKTADGITVVIDVFRASNTIIACLEGGVDHIIPVGDLKDAYSLKRDNPEHLLFGERGGIPPEGFDHDNSPAKATKLNLNGKKIILTTSAGSLGIVHSKNAEEILIGSFANADAIVEYVKDKNPEKISLLAIGNEAIESATEDEECARYLKSQLENKKMDLDLMRSEILKSDGANRLRRLGQQEDMEFCLELNTSRIIPKFDRKTGKITAFRNGL